MECFLKFIVLFTVLSFANAQCSSNPSVSRHFCRNRISRNYFSYHDIGEEWKLDSCKLCTCGKSSKVYMKCYLPGKSLEKDPKKKINTYYVDLGDGTLPTECPRGLKELEENKSVNAQMILAYQVSWAIDLCCDNRMVPTNVPDICEVREDGCDFKVFLKGYPSEPCPGPIGAVGK